MGGLVQQRLRDIEQRRNPLDLINKYRAPAPLPGSQAQFAF